MTLHSGPKRPVVIALDGPSALIVHRDRTAHDAQPDDLNAEAEQTLNQELHQLVNWTPGPQSDDSFWLSDETIAATLAAENALGHKAFAEDKLDQSIGKMIVGAQPRLVESRARSLAHCSSTSRDLKRMPYDELGLYPPTQATPLYILVPNTDSQRRVRNVHQRCCTYSLPMNSLMKLGNQVLVPNPELTFLLLAHYLDLAQLIAVGMEMCGRYRMAQASPASLLQSSKTLYNQAPLTTPNRIARLLKRMKDFPGARKAERACTYLEPNSASPMETNLYLLLCLPRKLGGYALPRPILNVKRKVNAQVGTLTFSRVLMPDLYWASARLDMEYDSDEFHADSESLQKGARRTLALRAIRVDVMPMTYDVITDVGAFDAVAHLVARRLQKRVRGTDAGFEARRQELRASLGL